VILTATVCFAFLTGQTREDEILRRIQESSTHAVVLSYHNIVQQRTKNSSPKDCTVAEFRSQIEEMKKRNVTFLQVKDFLDVTDNRQWYPQRAVLVTFNGNWRSFKTLAWPILKANRIPTIMFVPTSKVAFLVDQDIARTRLTFTELLALADEGLMFASMTASEPEDLTALPPLALRKELEGSLRFLRGNDFRMRKGFVKVLAYPNAKVNKRVLDAVRDTYWCAFTEVPKRVHRYDRDTLALPRYLPSQFNQAMKDLFALEDPRD
jgi:peptidoglycan/xylan/chitin deacetylase (PgdA/CDA1 family)